MKDPTFPKYTTLVGRALARLLMGQKFTHRDFQKQTATYRLSSCIEQLRNRYGWTIESIEETAQTSDRVGRSATYARYQINDKALEELRNQFGERIDKFVQAVLRFESEKSQKEGV